MSSESEHLYNHFKYIDYLFQGGNLHSYKSDTTASAESSKYSHDSSISFMIQHNNNINERYNIAPYNNKETTQLSMINRDMQNNGYFINILDYCVQNECPISFYINSDSHKYKLFRITLLPITQPRNVKIFTNISQCFENDPNCAIDDYIDTVTCIITQNKKGPRIIKRISAGFVNFAHLNLISFKDIIYNQSVNECFLRSSPSTSPLILKYSSDSSDSFTVYSVPYFGENDSLEVLVTLIPSANTASPEPINCNKGITIREQEIINLAATGCTNRYIAHKLLISEGTVKKTLHNAYKKLGIGSRMELIKLFHS